MFILHLLIGAVVDQFGDNVVIHRFGDGHFAINVEVTVSPKFMSWLLGFGQNAELLSPQSPLDRLRQDCARYAEMYRD